MSEPGFTAGVLYYRRFGFSRDLYRCKWLERSDIKHIIKSFIKHDLKVGVIAQFIAVYMGDSEPTLHTFGLNRRTRTVSPCFLSYSRGAGKEHVHGVN